MDRGNKSIPIMEIEALPSWSSTKTKGKLAQKLTKEILSKMEKGKCYQPQKEQKINTQASTQSVSIAKYFFVLVNKKVFYVS